jgi:hypothetical protein
LPIFRYENPKQLLAELDAKVVKPIARWEEEQDRKRILQDKIQELESEQGKSRIKIKELEAELAKRNGSVDVQD